MYQDLGHRRGHVKKETEIEVMLLQVTRSSEKHGMILLHRPPGEYGPLDSLTLNFQVFQNLNSGMRKFAHLYGLIY
jgi:hypothetical protein